MSDVSIIDTGPSSSPRVSEPKTLPTLKVPNQNICSESELEPNSPPSGTGLDQDLANLDKLTDFHQKRFQRLGELDDIEKAIEYGTHAVDSIPDSHKQLPAWIGYLGTLYSERFRRLGELEDAEKALQLLVHALKMTPGDHPELSGRCISVGTSYGDRFRRLGKQEDLEKSIEYYSHALELTPNSHPNLSDRHANLGLAYGDRFWHLGDMKDFEKSLEYRTQALALTPSGHPSLPFRYSDLGICYTDRFRRFGDLNDLEKALEYRLRGFELTPNDHPDLRYQHGNLGISYNDRFGRLDALEDLEKAIYHQHRALALTPDGHPDLALWHAALGETYNDRFGRLGGLEDLETSVEHRFHALKLTPDNHPDLPRRHGHLGAAYADRFQFLGEPGDFETSLEHRLRALALTPDGHPDLPYRHAELGVSYTARFHRLGELNDLENSLEHRLQALALTPDGHPDLSRQHSNVGKSYSDRFERLGEQGDLEKSLEHRIYALALTPEGHPHLSRYHFDLGVSYYDRFKYLGNLEDIERAIEHQYFALDLTPDGHPDLTMLYFNIALSHLFQFKHTNDLSHSEATLRSFRSASQLVTGAPRIKFQCALSWARHASDHSFLNSIEAYQATIDLMPQFIWLGATTSQRYQDLSTVENLAVDAVYDAMLHSNYTLALEWMEHARCVVWSQNLMLRSPLDQLHSLHPDLASRLQTVANQLHHASSELPVSQALSSGADNPEYVGKHRRRLAKEYNELLLKIRGLPGFDGFLQPLRSTAFMTAARNGPIELINCHVDRCDALLVLPGINEIQHLPLPNFTEQKAQDARVKLESSLRRKGLRQRGVAVRLPSRHKDGIAGVLLALWNDVVKPILDFLGFMNDLRVDSLPHITWCPTGAMTLLPLHAAGDYSQPRSSVFHYAISSYTPTLTVLLSSNPSQLDRSPRVLAVGQAHTPGHAPLPGTARELELVQLHTESKANYSQLTDSQATTSAVLDAMEQHDWVHLACHAHQNVSDPTKSEFYLHEGTLDLDSINRRSFKNKGLAFLSACQTATGDEALPDEAIHLASGMLMAGYPSVIATMWSVVDEDAPLVADKVYAQLMKDGKVGNGEAGKALHYAVAELRAKVGEKEFERWVPYIHIGS